jgi:hypothetical protein
VDISAIVSQAETKAMEAAEKKMEAVFKSMLSQQGFDSQAITAMTNEWKSKQVTPEQEIIALNIALQAERDTVARYEKANVLHKYGIADENSVEYIGTKTLIERMMTDGKDFQTAAAEYFTANPRTVPQADPQISQNEHFPIQQNQAYVQNPIQGIAGQYTLTPPKTPVQQYNEMTPAERITFKRDNPTLFAKVKEAMGFV